MAVYVSEQSQPADFIPAKSAGLIPQSTPKRNEVEQVDSSSNSESLAPVTLAVSSYDSCVSVTTTASNTVSKGCQSTESESGFLEGTKTVSVSTDTEECKVSDLLEKDSAIVNIGPACAVGNQSTGADLAVLTHEKSTATGAYI